MHLRTLVAILESISGYLCVALGSVLQKKGIGWIGHRGEKRAPYYRDLIFWATGFLLMNLALVPNFLALRTLSAPIVSAISGLNIVFLIFLSRLILKEKIYPTDYVYGAAIFAAIVALNLVDQGTPGSQALHGLYAYLFGLIPVGLFVVLALAGVRKRGRGWGIAYAAIGGGLGGLLAIFMKILQVQHGTDFLLYLSSPYLYVFLAVTTASFVSIQLAYKTGDMIVVGPVQFATMVFYPVLASYPIFALAVNPVQVILFAVIIAGVIRMVVKHNC